MEEKIINLEREVSEIKERLIDVVRELESQSTIMEKELHTFTMSLSNMLEAMSIIRYYALTKKPPNLDDLKQGPISCLLELIKRSDFITIEETRSFFLSRVSFILGSLIELAANQKIAANELLSFLIEELGLENLTNFLDINDVIRSFSSEEAMNWKDVLNI